MSTCCLKYGESQEGPPQEVSDLLVVFLILITYFINSNIMGMRSREISSIRELDDLVTAVRAAADRTVRAVRDILASESDSLQVLRLMKFSEIGHHPIEDRTLNLIEQVNQTFTYLVTLEAARWLLTKHPEADGLRISLGTAAGFDLESRVPGLLAAEAFAATHPGSNDKLRKDLHRLATKANGVKYRYVFFSSPKFPSGRHMQLEADSGVEVWSLLADSLLKGAA